jgi:hypothetical protein
MKLHSHPGGHFYEDKNVLYPSVTTIIGSYPNPEIEEFKRQVFNWKKIMMTAAKFGTEVHKEIEHALTGKRQKIKHKMQFRAFQAWQQEVGFKCSGTEIKVKSKKGYGGSLDLLGWIPGKHFIIDLKTSRQIYPEMLLQLSAYKYAFLETSAIKEIEIGVLRLDKTKEAYEWHPYTEEEYKEGIMEFLNLCKEWHANHNVKKEFSKKFVLEG